MPMNVVKATWTWNEERTRLSVIYEQVVKLKNKVAQRWLSKGWAVTVEDAKWLNGTGRDALEKEVNGFIADGIKKALEEDAADEPIAQESK